MSTLAAVVVDAGVVLAVALCACRALARRPAALRHAVLAAAVMVAAVVPALEAALPRWELPVLSGARLTDAGVGPSLQAWATTQMVVESSDALRFTWTDALVGLWGIGSAIVAAGLLAGAPGSPGSRGGVSRFGQGRGTNGSRRFSRGVPQHAVRRGRRAAWT